MLQMINTLVSLGYTADQLINYLSNQSSGLKSGVKNARAQGYTPEQILKFLSQRVPKGNSKKAVKSANDFESYLQASGYKTEPEKRADRYKSIRRALGAGATAAAALGAYKAYQALGSDVITPEVLPALPQGQAAGPQQTTIDIPGQRQLPYYQKAIGSGTNTAQAQLPYYQQLLAGRAQQQLPYQPDSPRMGPQGSGQFIMQPSPAIAKPVQPPEQLIQETMQTDQGAPAAASAETIEAPIIPPIAPSDVIKQKKLDTLIMSMSAGGEKPEDIAEYLTESRPEYVQSIEALTKEPLLNSIYRFLGKKQKKPKLADTLQQDFQREYGQPQQAPKVPSEEAAPAKLETVGSLALTPEGDIGEIKAVKQGIATIDVDGKQKTRKVDDLEHIGLSNKDLASLHGELIAGIQKATGQEVSRNVHWAGYDPNTNQLAYLPHGGRLYLYDDIPQEYVDELTDILAQRRSSGSNFIGAWDPGSKSPIGSRMFDLIKKLQAARGGKGKEYSGKFDIVYSAYEPAIEAAKQKAKEMSGGTKNRKAKK